MRPKNFFWGENLSLITKTMKTKFIFSQILKQMKQNTEVQSLPHGVTKNSL